MDITIGNGQVIDPSNGEDSIQRPVHIRDGKIAMHPESVSEKLDMPGGIHVVEPDPEQLQQRIDEGHTFIAYSVDMRMLECSCKLGIDTAARCKK